MLATNFKTTMLIAVSLAFFCGCHSQKYSDLQANGINCPSRDKCHGYRNNLTYLERSCECDSDCTAYNDCCIDALPMPEEKSTRPPLRTDVKCLHYGAPENHTGVYVISKCSKNWNGSRKVRQRCLGRNNFTDPLTAAPVTDVDRKITYRNLACAECNNANLTSLKTFQLKLACNGLEALTPEEIFGNLTYNQEYSLWGVNKLNRHRNETDFYGCDVIFDVPEYLDNSIRFCRSNLISKCATGWTRPHIATLCGKYMTVVYSNTRAYRNPDCAICNHKTVGQISCTRSTVTIRHRPMSFVLMFDVNERDEEDQYVRKRAMSFALLFDINRSDGEIVGMRPITTPECESKTMNIYDPFFKKCRELKCALPGYIIEHGKCVKG